MFSSVAGSLGFLQGCMSLFPMLQLPLVLSSSDILGRSFVTCLKAPCKRTFILSLELLAALRSSGTAILMILHLKSFLFHRTMSGWLSGTFLVSLIGMSHHISRSFISVTLSGSLIIFTLSSFSSCMTASNMTFATAFVSDVKAYGG